MCLVTLHNIGYRVCVACDIILLLLYLSVCTNASVIVCADIITVTAVPAGGGPPNEEPVSSCQSARRSCSASPLDAGAGGRGGSGGVEKR